ncbi:hypothetical protein BC936DRAFT_148748 [Jimgerdemannia flammicorona]|uniref:WD40-repeat-containing domain protein n=1 Tax=Jimgerdemannia flammicorona TaxID=994334 RepID=A0A433D2C8_9FUNG|nr:hypothetical protein BC936DRAFT_148748 [Jimgerdemannia flammicorona]
MAHLPPLASPPTSRLCEEPKIWYTTFVTAHPRWSQGLPYTTRTGQLAVDWKQLVLDGERKRRGCGKMRFEFVNDDRNRDDSLDSRKRLQWDNIEAGLWEQADSSSPMDADHEYPSQGAHLSQPATLVSEHWSVPPVAIVDPPFCVQDPLVSDIDRITGTGYLATGKHRISQLRSQSEHRFLFWSYPNWTLIRTFDLALQQELCCQIVGIQTVTVGNERCTIFTIAVGTPMHAEEDEEEDRQDQEDRVDVWKEIRVYRLYEDGVVQPLGAYEVQEPFLGRDVFVFPADHETVKQFRTNDTPADQNQGLVVMLTGARLPWLRGCVLLLGVDLRPRDEYDLEASSDIAPRAGPSSPAHAPPALCALLIRKFGAKLSCMHHLRLHPQLNHLIFTGSYNSDNLTLWDWRSGSKVGVFPGRAGDPYVDLELDMQDDAYESDDEDSDQLFPWGLESTMILPPADVDQGTGKASASPVGYGLRLIAVGDNREDRLEIRVWDIDHLLTVSPPSHPITRVPANQLPYSPPANKNPLILHHSFHKPKSPEMDKLNPMALVPIALADPNAIPIPEGVPIKYAAYNVMSSMLFMLTEQGEVTVIDIESGEIIGVRANVAPESTVSEWIERRVSGIDICVVGGREVVVTTKQGIMRGFGGIEAGNGSMVKRMFKGLFGRR